ncbi:cbb3-type cytochrome c oxidase subunit I [Thiohalophilus sp.]|uniref:cbb3-type cytochrome c oxidase subunit I n=1 Tax=Thiohalophilus sp. TaxID=3028392 RepID=UPI002ACDA049|nr:cbb3-type cytochrome c oxidase subunit I [Thiohalophilus sp.]MDZ7805442.1 cbb3-type cytochrome c oxidase subunit I [Thiohalophilus sp.]
MTELPRRFVKTAFVFLILGLLLGGWMLLRRELYGEWPHPYLISAHTHIMFVGFVMFMILGVALWLFPKPSRDDPRYRENVIRWVYWLLLGGTLLRFGGELWRGMDDVSLLAWAVIAGGFLQIGAIVLYIWTMWKRIRTTTGYKRQRVSREALHDDQ